MFSTCVPLRLWGQSLTLYSQTELLINTNVAVSEIHQGVVNTHAVVSGLEHNVTSAHTMVRDIHRTILGGQEGNGDSNSPVSDGQVS